MTEQELKETNDANDALMAWFKSQDIAPSKAMIQMAAFMGCMIGCNSQTNDDVDRKIKLMNDTIMTYVILYQLGKALPK